ncbi:MAG: tRNA epoxyqueuosine(34) reductase QueG, partial [Phycisphaeraceae bacterium]
LLIHPRRGSWLLLGGIVTTLELVPPRTQRVEPDRCGSCTRCIDACPTDAITPYRVDASRCISYLTIEHRPPIQREFFEAMGDWIFGCDICQEVCPHNSVRSGKVPTGRAHPAYAERTGSFDLLEVLGWTEEDRRVAFAKSALKRAKLDMMKRNAVIAAGNVLRSRDDPALRAKITHLAFDREESGQVRDAARTVLDVLAQCDGSADEASPTGQSESRDPGERD